MLGIMPFVSPQPPAEGLPQHRRRWDKDERGHGVASGEALLPDLDALRGAMARPDWIAEEPEIYLGEHFRRACNRDGAPMRLTRVATEDAVLVLNLEAPHSLDKSAIRAEVLAILGSFVEASTFMRETAREGAMIFDVATGMLDGDGPHAGHGHLVRFIVTTSPS